MSKLDLVLYNQNIWGNFSSPHCVSNRNALISGLISKHGADVCCFQECNPTTSRADGVDLAVLLSPRYAEVPTFVGKQNFTPIFYNKEKLKVISSGFCAFPGFNDINSKSLTWCVLADKVSSIPFGVISTHFWYKASGEIDDLQRLENAKIVLSYVKSLELRYNVPVFVCGDLNCGIGAKNGEGIYHYLKENLLDIRDIAPITTSVMTCHAAPAINEFGRYEDKVGACVCTLDYMFLSSNHNTEVHSFAVDQSDFAWNSSDHCPLIAKISVSSNLE